MLNVTFGSPAPSAPSHGKLMFPTNSVECYSTVLEGKVWGAMGQGQRHLSFHFRLQDMLWVMMKGKSARH